MPDSCLQIQAVDSSPCQCPCPSGFHRRTKTEQSPWRYPHQEGQARGVLASYRSRFERRGHGRSEHWSAGWQQRHGMLHTVESLSDGAGHTARLSSPGPAATEVILLLFVSCLTSQQHASVSQEQICSDNCTFYHTEIDVADQTFYLTQSQLTDTGPFSLWHMAE